MFARTLACAALVTVAAAACSSSTPAATPGAASSSTAPAAAVTTAKAAAMDASAVAAKLKAAGLPVGAVTVYTAATDPNHLLGRPGGYTSKVAFADTRIGPKDTAGLAPDSIDLGGSVEVFSDAAGAEARFDYGQKLAQAMPMLTEYDYLSGPVLLRVSKVLTPDQAAGYQKALG